MIFRPVERRDYAGVAACLRRNEMTLLPEDEWLRVWDEHPYAADFADVPRGFVLEVEGEIVGTIANLWAKYWLNGRTLKVAISGSAAVDPAHRGGSIKLMGETVRQRGVDLYLNGSPSAVASKIMESLKVRRVPQPNYDVSLLWPAAARRVALAGLKRRRIPLAALASVPAGMVLAARAAAKGSSIRANARAEIESGFSSDFDEFWERRRSEFTRLIAFRDRAMLEWRYGRMLANGRARLLTVRRSGRLVGFTVLVRTAREKLGIEEYLIHDVQVLGDDPGVTAALIRGARRETKAAGLDLLEWVGQSGPRRDTAERTSSLTYQLDVWQAYYYTRDADLKRELDAPDRWSFGPYDSD
jgi:hypothetical protein